MRPAPHNVAPVRQGYAPQGSNRAQMIKLSPAERETAKSLGLDEKVYLQHLIQDRKLQQQKGRR